MTCGPPPIPRHRPRSVREALLTVGVAALILLVLFGDSIRESGQTMPSGWERTMVLAVGHPAGWVTDRLGLGGGDPRTAASPEAAAPARGGGPGPVGPEAFDPAELGARPSPPRRLRTVLVTGDSMSMPLDAQIARALAGTGAIETIRDPHLGTGLSQTDLVDWRVLATQQVRKHEPEAVVVLLGANEGFPIGSARCCGPNWAAAYATRARRMMGTYRQRGAARVYWLLLPGPRDGERRRITRVVNAALRAAAAPYRAQVRLLDLPGLFTPGYRYRDSIEIDGRQQIVRSSDGVHLNDAGARLAAEQVLVAMQRDFGDLVPARP